MKTIYTTLLLLVIFTTGKAQILGLDNPRFKDAKKKLELQVDSLKKYKPLDEYNGSWIARLEKEFYIDTFYIERLWVLEIDYNGSTMGMNQASRRAEVSYDKLLNKFYDKLIYQLRGEDKKKLKTSQRNWMKFRESEKQLNYTLLDDQYTGGGTIHKIFVASKSAEITKQRVIELYHYLDRIWQPKK